MEAESRELESPIFALCIIKDIIIVAMGGGNKKCGVKNKLVSFRINEKGFSNELFSLDLDNDVPYFLEPDEERGFFAACMNNFFIVYKMNTIDGRFKEIFKKETMDYFDADKYQSVIRIKENYFGVGTSIGQLKIYKFNYINDKINSCEIVSEKENAHCRGINNIIMLPKKNILFTASGDGTVKLFEMSSLKELNKISFREKIEETSNYFMRDIFFNERNNCLYSLQSHLHSKSYLTKWSLSNGLQPMETIEVSETVCGSMKYNQNEGIVGITGSDGYIYFVDVNKNMKIIKEKKIGENMIKSGMFYKNIFATGSTDNHLRSTKFKGSCCFSLFGLIKLMIFILVAFRVYWLREKKKTN